MHVQSPGWTVQATAVRSTLSKQAGDQLELDVTSSQPGIVTVLLWGKDQQLYKLLPNALFKNPSVPAGHTVRIGLSPNPAKAKVGLGFDAGTSHLLVIVSAKAREYSGDLADRDLGFIAVDPAATRTARINLHDTRSQALPVLAGYVSDCQQNSCDRFGATQLNIELVD